MKISDFIRRGSDSAKEQLQEYSQEYLGTEKDPESVLPVDTVVEPEKPEEVSSSEMENMTQSSKTVVDTGFLTESEKDLLNRCGWTVVSEASASTDLALKDYLEGVQRILRSNFKARAGSIIQEVNKVIRNL